MGRQGCQAMEAASAVVALDLLLAVMPQTVAPTTVVTTTRSTVTRLIIIRPIPLMDMDTGRAVVLVAGKHIVDLTPQMV
uniref:Putative secreted protein n=1 Tax=Anopheles darlingi TaxID=43151 RepID=A0A2M4DHI4_ANODA